MGIALLMLTISCKQKPVASADNGRVQNTISNPTAGKKIKTNYNKEGIPDACDLLSLETVGRALGLDPLSISLNDGSSKKRLISRACFFRWEDAGLKNAGMMISLQKNPMADEVPDYLVYLIDGKIKEGEQDFIKKTKIKFEEWKMGDKGAYSKDLGKYMWRKGKDWVFTIAFNTTFPQDKEYQAAQIVAQEMIQKFDLMGL